MKKITKVRLMERLRLRFGLEEMTPEMFAIFEKILPVTQIDELAKEYGVLEYSVASATTTGFKTAMTVNKGMRYFITGIHMRQVSGAFTINEWLVQDTSAGQNMSIEDAFTAASDHKYIPPGEPIVLEEDDTIRVNVQSVTTGGNLGTTVFGWKEEIY